MQLIPKIPVFWFVIPPLLLDFRHKVDSSAVSKQLPSLVLYEGGKETKRRPLVDRRAVVTPYTFTEVCMYVLKAFFSSANF